MDNLSQQISALLSDPEMMSKIKGLSSMFSEQNTAPPSTAPPPVSVPASAPLMAENKFPNDAVNMVMRLAPLLQSVNQEDDSTRLLKALRPFLHEERRAKLDEAVKMLGFMRLLPALKNMKLM
ncbi:MAG: hypothetical protein ACI4M3_06685 [Acutalibacteraceae bacterium]